MLKKELKWPIFLLIIGSLTLLIVTYIMSGRFLFFDIIALIAGVYLIIESGYSCKEKEPLFFVYLKAGIGSWFVGEHSYLMLYGRC